MDHHTRAARADRHGRSGSGDWEAITEEPKAIEPTASLRSAIYALSFPRVTRLLVRRREDTEPEGVVTDYDLTVKGNAAQPTPSVSASSIITAAPARVPPVAATRPPRANA